MADITQILADAVKVNLAPLRKVSKKQTHNTQAQGALLMGGECMAAGIANSLADYLAKVEPNFDREAFLRATDSNPTLAALFS